MIHRAKNSKAVISGEVKRFVTGEIKLKVLKLYEINGSVKTVADIVTIKEDMIIVRSLVEIFNTLQGMPPLAFREFTPPFIFAAILLIKLFADIIPAVAENES